MAKRFTDTEKWKKPFIRGLQGAYKLLWLYILDDCDHAGIWQVDLDVAKIRLSEPELSKERAEAFFASKIISFSDNEKWFIPDFLAFQYGELNPANRAHRSVLSLLKKHGLPVDGKGLLSPLEGAKDKDKDKDKDMDMDKDKDKDKDRRLGKFEFYRTFDHLRITKGEVEKLQADGFTLAEINSVLDSIENHRSNKNYKSLYLTAKKWLAKDRALLPKGKIENIIAVNQQVVNPYLINE